MYTAKDWRNKIKIIKWKQLWLSVPIYIMKNITEIDFQVLELKLSVQCK